MILIYDPTRVFSFPGHFPLSGWYHPTILAFQIKSLPALFDASPSLTSGHSYLPSITEPYQFPAKQIQNLSTSHHVHGYYPTLSQYHFPSPNWSPGFHLCPSHPFPTQEPELQFFKKKKKKKEVCPSPAQHYPVVSITNNTQMPFHGQQGLHGLTTAHVSSPISHPPLTLSVPTILPSFLLFWVAGAAETGSRCHSGWGSVAVSRLTTTSASQAQMILLSQPPE